MLEASGDGFCMLRYRNRSSAAVLLLCVMMTSFLGIGLFGMACLQSLSLPDVGTLLERPLDPSHTSKILAADGTVIMAYGKFAHHPVPISAISPDLVDAVLATEDRRFYQHQGIDPLGVSRAMIINLLHGDIREGGSTLSQQLARTLYLTNERSWIRKLREAAIALQLEHHFNKRQILALYLNNAYFGEGAYGAEAASRVYFNKSAVNLTLNEAATLAGLIQAPSRYNPFVNESAARQRRNQVLDNLIDTDKLSIKTVESIKHLPVRVKEESRRLSQVDQAPYFNRNVLHETTDLLEISEEDFWRGGYRVRTTLNLRAQKLAERHMSKLLSWKANQGPTQGALISLDNRNRIIAYVGGKDFNQYQYDHVRQAHRQAGSLFKVLVYASAFQHGLTPTSMYGDTPISFGRWSPHNYDRRHHGHMTLTRALVESNNVVAVKVLQDIQPENVIRLAHEMGIQSSLSPNLSLALGAADVTLEEMTGAFSVLRAHGIYRQPYTIEKIEDEHGHLLFENRFTEHGILNRTVRDSMVAIMRKVLQEGTGRAAQLPAHISMDTAGKTGTSDGYRDAWFVGFTPDITTGVWVGNDDNRRMPGITGGTIPAKIWRSYMAAYLPPDTKRAFDLTQALPLQDRNSLLSDLNTFDKPPNGSWAMARSWTVERLTATLENKKRHIHIRRESSERTTLKNKRHLNPFSRKDEATATLALEETLPAPAKIKQPPSKRPILRHQTWKNSWIKMRKTLHKMLESED
jgi:penicillin-binding protein 1A